MIKDSCDTLAVVVEGGSQSTIKGMNLASPWKKEVHHKKYDKKIIKDG